MATKFRRSTPSWFQGAHADNCGCGACGTVSCCESQFADGSFVSCAGMYPQTVCSLQGCDGGDTCGCDACSSAMTSDWQIDGSFSSGAYSASPSGCGCGENVAPDAATFSSGATWEYSNPNNSPLMNGHVNPPQSGDARTFAPSGPQMLPIPPDASPKSAPAPPADSEPVPMPIPMPMPQDLTPMDSDSESPKNPLFDPLSEEGVPAAESPLDPASFEVPLLPPLPVPDHASSGKRVSVP